jgi:hypothetical protein
MTGSDVGPCPRDISSRAVAGRAPVMGCGGATQGAVAAEDRGGDLGHVLRGAEDVRGVADPHGGFGAGPGAAAPLRAVAGMGIMATPMWCPCGSSPWKADMDPLAARSVWGPHSLFPLDQRHSRVQDPAHRRFGTLRLAAQATPAAGHRGGADGVLRAPPAELTSGPIQHGSSRICVLSAAGHPNGRRASRRLPERHHRPGREVDIDLEHTIVGHCRRETAERVGDSAQVCASRARARGEAEPNRVLGPLSAL